MVRPRGALSRAVVGMMIAAQVSVAQESHGGISSEAQEAIRLLSEEDAFDRQMGFLRLEALREPATAVVVRQYLDDRNTDTRAFAVRALAAIEKYVAIPVLLERLKGDRSPRVRIAALLALEPFQDPSVRPVLIEKLRDASPQVRMAAVDVVSRLDDPKAREAIRTRWRRERHRDVRRVLQAAIDRIGTP